MDNRLTIEEAKKYLLDSCDQISKCSFKVHTRLPAFKKVIHNGIPAIANLLIPVGEIVTCKIDHTAPVFRPDSSKERSIRHWHYLCKSASVFVHSIVTIDSKESIPKANAFDVEDTLVQIQEIMEEDDRCLQKQGVSNRRLDELWVNFYRSKQIEFWKKFSYEADKTSYALRHNRRYTTQNSKKDLENYIWMTDLSYYLDLESALSYQYQASSGPFIL